MRRYRDRQMITRRGGEPARDAARTLTTEKPASSRARRLLGSGFPPISVDSGGQALNHADVGSQILTVGPGVLVGAGGRQVIVAAVAIVVVDELHCGGIQREEIPRGPRGGWIVRRCGDHCVRGE